MGWLDDDKPKKKRQVSQAVKNWAWDNCPHKCAICGKRVTKISEAEFDHLKAYSKGGASNLSNVKITHRVCNRIKGKKTLTQAKRLLGIKTKKKKATKKRVKVGETLWGEPIYKYKTVTATKKKKKAKKPTKKKRKRKKDNLGFFGV